MWMKLYRYGVFIQLVLNEFEIDVTKSNCIPRIPYNTFPFLPLQFYYFTDGNILKTHARTGNTNQIWFSTSPLKINVTKVLNIVISLETSN